MVWGQNLRDPPPAVKKLIILLVLAGIGTAAFFAGGKLAPRHSQPAQLPAAKASPLSLETQRHLDAVYLNLRNLSNNTNRPN